MGVKKFKFVSPGIFIDEIDNSQLPGQAPPIGPVVIGRFERGPQMRPTMVSSFSEFVDVFGLPIPGGKGGDVWREGNYTAPTYAAYAAQAWLRNSSPVTIVRLAGHQHENPDTDATKPGWAVAAAPAFTSTGVDDGTGAYGLFCANSGSLNGPTAAAATTTLTVSAKPANGETLVLNTLNGTKTFTITFHFNLAESTEWAENGDDHAWTLDTNAGSITNSELTNRIQAVLNNAAANYAAAFPYTVTESGDEALVITANSAVRTTHDFGTNVMPATGVTESNKLIGADAGNGVLAAVWYLTEGSIVLTGKTPADVGTTLTGSATVIGPPAAREYEAIIYNSAGTAVEQTRFNFNEDSDKYIRKVFNTNPTLTNDVITDPEYVKTYWLGETYERAFFDNVTNSTQAVGDYQTIGVILSMGSASINGGNAFALNGTGAREAETGWFISQDLTTNYSNYKPESMQKLFKLVSLNDASWGQKNLKISIQDIKASNSKSYTYGTFSVVVRSISDSDKSVKIVERFSNCELNPNSPNYIGRKIGDKYVVWNDSEARYREYGDFTNNSKYLRVQVNSEVAAGSSDARYLPFGVYGPLRYSGFSVVSGAAAAGLLGTPATAETNVFARGNLSVGRSRADAANFIDFGAMGSTTMSFVFPAPSLRVSASHQNLSSPRSAYFGVDTTVQSTNSTLYEKSISDLVRPFLGGSDAASSFTATTGSSILWTPASGVKTEYSYIFSLDDVGSGSAAEGADSARYETGLRATGASYTAALEGYKEVLSQGFDRYTTLMHGGYDGINVREREPFRDGLMTSQTPKSSSTFYSVKKAIDSVSDPEVVEMNLITMPGIRTPELTQHLIDVCEERADVMAIIDINGGYTPSTEGYSSEQDRSPVTAVTTVANNVLTRGIDSSYAATYWPWVQIQDTINGAALWAPPSIAALGTLSYSEKNSELWFAPAGFNRGGISTGAAGIPVIGLRQRLTSEERDKLYDANINPIASFPSEGIVIFGQKTLQVTPSALDRINVRRLLIFLKKEISRIAATMLFEQNVKATWNRFVSKVSPVLSSVKARLGVADFKFILDETTTTPDLVDRNIVYAKVFLKPVKAIEFIALDFVITDQGASFED